jgi:DNA-binding MarR family transcriptional regulator
MFHMQPNPAPQDPECDPVLGFRLSDFLPFRVNRLTEHLTGEILPIYRDLYGITRPQWRVLAHLGACGPNSARDLVALTALDKVQVSRAVAELDARGWLTRAGDDRDRRVQVLRLTEAGSDAFRTLVPLLVARQETLLHSLSPQDRAALDQGLNALEKALGIGCRQA